MGKVYLMYVGIDGWSRPVFKDIERREYYGSTDQLFAYGSTEMDVKKKLCVEGLRDEFHLCYFGNHFGCEPMGSTAKDLHILWDYESVMKPFRKRLKDGADKGFQIRWVLWCISRNTEFDSIDNKNRDYMSFISDMKSTVPKDMLLHDSIRDQDAFTTYIKKHVIVKLFESSE